MLATKNSSNVEIVKYLVEECKCDLDSKDIHGDTPIMAAALYNSNVRILKYLV